MEQSRSSEQELETRLNVGSKESGEILHQLEKEGFIARNGKGVSLAK